MYRTQINANVPIQNEFHPKKEYVDLVLDVIK